jgi:hypothetical protein
MSNTQKDKQNDWKEREVGALWKKAGPKGSYCTGYIVSDELGNKTKQRVIMFSNKNKTNEKSPDFVIYLSNEQDGQAGNTQAAKPKAIKKPVQAPEPQEEEIPDL